MRFLKKSESENEDVATMAFKASPHHSTTLFEDLTNDEDQDQIMSYGQECEGKLFKLIG